jgi:HAD superfamily hydrolase (TIGR01509 family)
LRPDPGGTSAVDLVVFDCDGVLVDSERVAVGVDQRVLADLGWALGTDEIVERFMGGTTAAFKAAVEEHLGRALPETWESPYEAWYEQAFVDELVAVDGVEEALDGLDVPTCVASNGPHRKLERTLGLTGLAHRFEGRVFSADDVVHGKPAPDLYLHAAEVLGVDPSRCVVVEDSRPGTTAALAAGMRVLGYAGGLTPGRWLSELGATVFEDMRDVPGLVRALRDARRG